MLILNIVLITDNIEPLDPSLVTRYRAATARCNFLGLVACFIFCRRCRFQVAETGCCHSPLACKFLVPSVVRDFLLEPTGSVLVVLKFVLLVFLACAPFNAALTFWICFAMSTISGISGVLWNFLSRSRVAGHATFAPLFPCVC